MKKDVWKKGVLTIILIVFLFALNNPTISGQEITLPEDCSEDEIVSKWDSLINSSSEKMNYGCNYDNQMINFIATKNETNETYYLIGVEKENSETISGIYANLNDTSKIPNQTELNSLSNSKQELEMFLERIQNPTGIQITPHETTEDAESEFKEHFKINSGELTFEDYSEQVSQFINTTENDQTTITKKVYSNIEHSLFYEEATINNQRTSETIDTNFNHSIKINNSNYDNSEDYSGNQEIEINEDGEARIKFNWNFSEESLNFSNVGIEKQTNTSSFGYLIVNGIEKEKEVYVDKVLSSNRLCVKNSEVSNISEVSTNCNATDESIISCPDNHGTYDCTTTESKYNIKGLRNSAVKELISCQENWDCADWSECMDGNRTRTCNDLNNCGTTQEKPAEVELCSTSSCTPDWDCTDWSPEECPQNKTQTRTCTDLNNCGSQGGMPSETQQCEYESGSGTIWIVVIIIILLILIGGAIVGVIYFIKKNKEPEQKKNQILPKSPATKMPVKKVPKKTTPKPQTGVPKLKSPRENKLQRPQQKSSARKNFQKKQATKTPQPKKQTKQSRPLEKRFTNFRPKNPRRPPR